MVEMFCVYGKENQEWLEKNYNLSLMVRIGLCEMIDTWEKKNVRKLIWSYLIQEHSKHQEEVERALKLKGLWRAEERT